MNWESLGVAIGALIIYIWEKVKKDRERKKEKAERDKIAEELRTQIEEQKKIQKQVEQKVKESTPVPVIEHTITDSKIDPILWTLLQRFNCLRVYILQFHNGNKFYTGQSIQRKTVTHEVPYEYINGMIPIKPTHENIPVSRMMQKIILVLEKQTYYYVEEPDMIKGENPDLVNWMSVYSVGSLIYLRINNKDGEMAAMLCLHFPNKRAINSGHIHRLTEGKKRLESIFMGTDSKQY